MLLFLRAGRREDYAGKQCYNDQVVAQMDCELETESWL